jgi:hypothetical protein
VSVFSEIAAEAETFKTKLAADAGHLLGEFEALWGKLTDQAMTDGADVIKKVEPVAAAAEADAAGLAGEAVAGAEGIVDPAKPSA